MLPNDLKTSLVGCLKELHLPTVRACYGQEADRARRESLTSERRSKSEAGGGGNCDTWFIDI